MANMSLQSNIFINFNYSSSFLGKPRQNESDSKPTGIRKPNLGLPSHTVSGQKRKDLSPVNPGW